MIDEDIVEGKEKPSRNSWSPNVEQLEVQKTKKKREEKKSQLVMLDLLEIDQMMKQQQ
jgi:hypothetical protein